MNAEEARAISSKYPHPEDHDNHLYNRVQAFMLVKARAHKTSCKYIFSTSSYTRKSIKQAMDMLEYERFSVELFDDGINCEMNVSW